MQNGPNWYKSSWLRRRIEIFRNEHTRSIPLDPKLIFWCISYFLGAFGTVWLPYETRCKTGQTSAKVRATKSRRNFSLERTRSTPLDPKLMFSYVSNYLGAFGAVWLPYETRCKMGRTSAKVRATKSRRNFSQRTRSTPLDPKLTFWCVSFHSRAFGTVWLPYELGAKCAELVQKFVPRSHIGIFCNERTRSTPLTLNSRFGEFLTIWVHSGPFCCLTKLGAKGAELVQKFVPRSRVEFFRNESTRSAHWTLN